MRKNRIIIISLFLTIGGSLVPYKTVSIPEWKIQLVDPSGRAVESIEVVQEWEHYNLVGEESETLISDQSGIVIFPARTYYAPLLFRILFRSLDVINSIAMLPHGSGIGARSTVIAKKAFSARLYYHEGEQLEHTLKIGL